MPQTQSGLYEVTFSLLVDAFLPSTMVSAVPVPKLPDHRLPRVGMLSFIHKPFCVRVYISSFCNTNGLVYLSFQW